MLTWTVIDLATAASPSGRLWHAAWTFVGAFSKRLHEAAVGHRCEAGSRCILARLDEDVTRAVRPTVRRRPAGLEASLAVIGRVTDDDLVPALDAFFGAIGHLGWPVVGPPRIQREPIEGSAAGGVYDVDVIFSTPVRLKADNALVTDAAAFTFPLFVDSLRRRLVLLTRLYGDGAAARAAFPRYRTIRYDATLVQEAGFRFVRDVRYAIRPDGRVVPVPSSGFVGPVRLRGVPGAALPLLRAGERLGVGQGCAKGLGAYSMTIHSS